MRSSNNAEKIKAICWQICCSLMVLNLGKKNQWKCINKFLLKICCKSFLILKKTNSYYNKTRRSQKTYDDDSRSKRNSKPTWSAFWKTGDCPIAVPTPQVPRTLDLITVFARKLYDLSVLYIDSFVQGLINVERYIWGYLRFR